MRPLPTTPLTVKPPSQLLVLVGGTVYIPANSTCTLQTPLVINNSNITIKGAGATSIINLASPTAQIIINSNPSAYIANVVLSSLIIQSQSNMPSIVAKRVYAGLVIDGITFQGGGIQIDLEVSAGFTINNTYHMGPIASNNVIFVYNSNNGVISHPTVVGYKVPPGMPGGGAVELRYSSNIKVTNPTISNIDSTAMTSNAGVTGVDFYSCNGCSLIGGTISGLLNGDGVSVQVSQNVSINGTTSVNNGVRGPPISGGGTGDGFDIFESNGVQLSNCNATGNGDNPNNLHTGIEIYTSQNVNVSNCNASNSGAGGVTVYGSPGTVLNNVTSNMNGWAGVYSVPALGTGMIQSDGITFKASQAVGESNFGVLWSPGTTIIVGGVANQIASVTDAYDLVLVKKMPSNSTQVSWETDSSLQVYGGQFNDNNNGTNAPYIDGITLGNTLAIVVGAQANDDRPTASKRQRYGISMVNGARVWVGYSDTFNGNLSGSIYDPSGLSSFNPNKLLGFDPVFYMSLYSDVNAAYGPSNYAGALNHWLTVGLPQGRRGSLEFDPVQYLTIYPDIAKAYGATNYKAAYNHWLNWGMPLDGRRGSIEIDPTFYLSQYSDLNGAYGPQNYIAAINHFGMWGLPEQGRRGSLEFDDNFYISNYPDLKAAFGSTGYSAALHHWIIQGLPVEGRQGSNGFSVRYYMQANPSVSAAYGPNNFLGALENWIYYGSNSGLSGI